MDISDYKGKRIKIVENQQNNNKICVLYPGMAYTLQAPIFFYLIELLKINNCDILGIDYRYYENIEFMNSSDEIKQEWIQFDSESIGKAVKQKIAKYEKSLYIGKSLGTSILMKQIELGLIGHESKLIWLTPGNSSKEIYELLSTTNNDSLIVTGTADYFYKEEYTELVKNKKNIRMMIMDKAGHSLEEAGDVEKSIENLNKGLKKIEEFIKE